MTDVLKTVALLTISNLFMTAAWYGHLRVRGLALPVAIAGSWGIALLEYCFQVPANRIGYRVLSAYQLKIAQEAITLVVFMGFATFWLGEGPQPKYVVAFVLIVASVVVATR